MHKILAAVDGSETAKLVVDRAVELARATGAKVRLLRAVTLAPAPPAPPGAFVPMQTEATVEEAEAWLQGLLERVPEKVQDGAFVELGSPAEAVCGAARSYGADVVVIGAHRYGVLARVLGTTAARIVNRIDRPVLVVRPVAADAAAIVDETARAGDLLRRDHARLELVYADLLTAYERGDWAHVRARFDAFEAALRAHMADEERDVLPAFHVAHAREADELRADHDGLRRELDAFGLRVDLHAAPLIEARSLIDRLRAHAAREETILYPWMNAELPLRAVHGLCPAA